MSSYRFSLLANSDLEEIVLYISRHNAAAAYRFLETVDETCNLLAAHPGLGRLRPELYPDLRSFPVGNYLIFYTITPEGIIIVRVIYGGRNLPTIFRQ